MYTCAFFAAAVSNGLLTKNNQEKNQSILKLNFLLWFKTESKKRLSNKYAETVAGQGVWKTAGQGVGGQRYLFFFVRTSLHHSVSRRQSEESRVYGVHIHAYMWLRQLER